MGQKGDPGSSEVQLLNPSAAALTTSPPSCGRRGIDPPINPTVDVLPSANVRMLPLPECSDNSSALVEADDTSFVDALVGRAFLQYQRKVDEVEPA
jgi:hypothetical protein